MGRGVNFMATDKQKQANKKNAQLSTGPKTPEGKSKVAKNATRHGIFSKELIINTGDGREDIDEYMALLDGLLSDFKPQGTMENLLVEKIAVSYWRLRRVIRYETGDLMDRLDDFKQKWITNLSNPHTNYTGDSPPRTLSYFSYKDEIKDEAFHEQQVLVDALTSPEADLTSIDPVLEYVYDDRSGEEGASKEDKLNRARQLIKELSSRETNELRVELLEQELEYLDEMQLVRKMSDKFDQISRLRSLPNPNDLDKIIKYETSLERSIIQNLSTLHTRQKNRIKVIDVNKSE